MAHMNQVKKAAIAAALKAVVPAGWKYSLAVDSHSSIVMTIRSAPVDLIAEMQACADEEARNRGETAYQYKGNADVNPYHYRNQFSANVETIDKIIQALNTGNWDRRDSMTDYFDVGHYVDLNIGRWNKPFVVAAAQEEVAA